MERKILKNIIIILIGLIMTLAYVTIKPSIVHANINEPKLSARAHVQTYGWGSGFKTVSNNEEKLKIKNPSIDSIVGTMGESKRMEALEVNVEAPKGVTIKYRAHVQTYGWMNWVTADNRVNTNTIGTTGESKRVEAIQLVAEGLENYEIKYRAHVQGYGWMDWVTASDSISSATAQGVFAGTMGESKRMEAFEIVIVPVNKTKIAVNDNHEHIYTEWEVTIPATCVKQGEQSRTCKICGKTETKVIQSHVIKRAEYKDVAATCTRRGQEHYVCELCGQDFFNLTPKLGHEWAEEETIDKVASCLEDGEKSIHCNRENCTERKDIVIIPKTGHDIEYKELQATCTQDAAKITTCKTCGMVIEKIVTQKAYGHRYINYTYNNDATCTSDGTETAYCENNCGTKHVRIKEGSRKEHTFRTLNDGVDPTCEKKGKEASKECIDCGYIKYGSTIPALGHAKGESIIDNSSCEGCISKVVCPRCGKVSIYAMSKIGVGHVWSSDGSHCTVCNLKAPNWTNEWANKHPGSTERIRIVWYVIYIADTDRCVGFEDNKSIITDAVIDVNVTFSRKAPNARPGYKFDGWYNAGTNQKVEESDTLKTTWKDWHKTFEPRYVPIT